MKQLRVSPVISVAIVVLVSLTAPNTTLRAQPQLTAEQAAALTQVDPAAVPRFGTF